MSLALDSFVFALSFSLPHFGTHLGSDYFNDSGLYWELHYYLPNLEEYSRIKAPGEFIYLADGSLLSGSFFIVSSINGHEN